MLGLSWFHRSIEQGRELCMDDHDGHVCTSGAAALRGKVPNVSPSDFSRGEGSGPVPTLISSRSGQSIHRAALVWSARLTRGRC
jgi:hypothetical protein